MKHQLRKNSLVVSVEGDILSTTADALRAAFVQMMDSDAIQSGSWDKLELDLTRSKIIDSAGLNLVVAIVKAMKLRGAAVIARVTNRSVHRTFVFTKLDRQMQVVLDEDA